MKTRAIIACLGILIATSACKRQGEKPIGAAALNEQPPVIIISIDTLRADHLPAYGYKGVETPAIDALRSDAILFTNAYSQCPLTLPSHVSMLTGLYPAQAGVRDNLGYTFDSAAHPTIPALLKQRGYATGAAVSAYVLRGASGLSRVFDSYDDAIDVQPGEALGKLQRNAGESIAIAQPWIESHKTQPFFYLLHLFEPHGPYEPVEPFRSRYASAYDGEIATVDHALGKFLDFLKSAGIYDRAVIILMSDHGEGLGDHGEDEHGIFLYKEAIHVPLIVKLPQQKERGTTRNGVAQLIDILPTVCTLAGAAIPDKLPGRSLLADGAPRTAYSETLYPRIHLGWSELHSLIDPTLHYIDSPSPELFHHVADPLETTNVLKDQRRAVAEMRRTLGNLRVPYAPPAAVDPEEAKKLAALGYLGSSAPSESVSLGAPKDHIGELRLMTRAMAAAHRGDHRDAIAIYRDVLERNPKFPDAWGQLAAAYRSAGMLQESVNAYKRGLEMTPSLRQEIALSLGSVLLEMGNYDESAAHAELALSAQEKPARLLLGRVGLARKDFVAAEQQARLVIPDHSYSLSAMVLLGQSLIGQRRYPEALATLESAREQAAKRDVAAPPLLNFALGDLLARTGRTAEAEAAFKEEIRLYPANRETYANLAVLYLLTGRANLADETFVALTRAVPGRSSYEFAARTLEEVGASREAARWRQRAVRGGA
ncbi:MAG: sulfatase-like hydrolase/transferase [Acidobacteriota bacterium]|nr:sulfatase-like hydrolase/transferase [Acidobacteriota bacterium]